MNDCAACGLPDIEARLCHFCRRTAELIRTFRCVACARPLLSGWSKRHEGKCWDCRRVRVSQGTVYLLNAASRARVKAA